MSYEVRSTNVASLLTQSPRSRILVLLDGLLSRALGDHYVDYLPESGSPILAEIRSAPVEKVDGKYYLRLDAQVWAQGSDTDNAHVIVELVVHAKGSHKCWAL